MKFKIAAFLAFLSISTLTATDLLRPHIHLSEVGAGILVELDFSSTTEEQWIEFLANPEFFHLGGYGMPTELGQAALPILTELIPVSAGEATTLFEQQFKQKTLADAELKSVPTPRLEEDPAAPLESFIWSPGREMISKAPQVGASVLIKGERYLPLTIHPVSINEQTGEVLVTEHLEIIIEGVSLGNSDLITDNGDLRAIVEETEYVSHLGHYLIITSDTYLPFLEEFVNWKQRKGHPVTITTLPEIGGSSASLIKEYISNAYNTWEVPPSYVLLIGDEDRGIPGFYVQNPQGVNLVTDHPYSLIEGDDSFPELWVGRISTDTSTELLNVLNKIMLYEKTPFMGNTNWYEKALMVGNYSHAISIYYILNWVKDKLMENGYSEVHMALSPETENIDDILVPINHGVSYIGYRGFGDYTGWWGPTFLDYNLYSLSNGPKLPLVTSVVCGGGNFAAGNDPCFGELWLRIGSIAAPRGAVAFFGPSELYTHTQFNNVIITGIYSGIFDDDIHTLGPALWAGKFELWRNYQSNVNFPFEQTPEFYQHIYNLLGDPGMQLWTQIPEELTVNHPVELSPNANHVTIEVLDSDDQPVSGAFVSLRRENDTYGLRTDESGIVILPVSQDSLESLDLTITGSNLQPYMASLDYAVDSYPVELTEWAVSGDGLLTAGASAAFQLSLQNGGTSLSNIELSLSSDHPHVQFTDSTEHIDILGPNFALEIAEAFEMTISAQAQHGEFASFVMEFTVADQSWEQQLSLPLQAPVLVLDEAIVLAGNPAAGDSIQVAFELSNHGGAATVPFQLVLLDHEFYDVSVDTLDVPVIGIDQTETSSSTSWIHFSDQIFPGELHTAELLCIQNDRCDTLRTEFSVGELNPYSPSRPDDYGYRMYDDQDTRYSIAPQYDWLEIAYSGVNLGLVDLVEGQDATVVVDLPFPVQFYGEVFEEITICTNGWVALGSSPQVSFHNRIIPSPLGPNAMIAPFWDDLVTGQGRVTGFTTSDNSRLYLEWSGMQHIWYDDDITFQMILYNTDDYPTPTGDNEIEFQYLSYSNQDWWSNYATIGIESPDYSTGLMATYNNIYDPSIRPLGPGRSILFTTRRAEQFGPPAMDINETEIIFTQNPWVLSTDSIAITNTGVSPLSYHLSEPGIPLNQPGNSGTSDGLRDGSDGFGYHWVGSYEWGGPTFEWEEISHPDNQLHYSVETDDHSWGPIPLGFAFPFYSGTYEDVYICSNGFLSFTANNSEWSNQGLPSISAPRTILAPWWDNLNFRSNNPGQVYFESNYADKAVITFENFPRAFDNHSYTFQVVLHGSGDIQFNYHFLHGDLDRATIGMQNFNRDLGMTIAHQENHSIGDSTSVMIHRPEGWFSMSNTVGQVQPGETEYVQLIANSQGMIPSNHSVDLLLQTNDASQLETPISVQLNVIAGELPDGDLNADYQVNANDLLTLMDFILMYTEPSDDDIERADFDGSGALDVLDAVYLVDVILSF